MLIKNIRNLIQNKFYLDLNSLNNCGQINSYIIQDIHYDIEQISKPYLAEGYVRDVDGNESPHMFVYIKPDEFNGKEPLIIDAALDQFTNANKDNGLVNSSFGKKTSFENVLICPISNSPYNHKCTKLRDVTN